MARLDIRVNKDSDVPVHEQIAAQVVLSIGSGTLKPGDPLPSTSELAQRLRLHKNTVSRAYHDPILKLLVESGRGKRLIVRGEPELAPGQSEIDLLIASFFRQAQRQGYSFQQIRARLQQRLPSPSPDHILVLSDDAGMRALLPFELRQRFQLPIQSCPVAELSSNPGLAVGALVVSAPGHIPKFASLLSPERPAVPITYTPANQYLELIQNLERPSLIALVSISEYFLKTARAVLAPVVGSGHAVRDCLLKGASSQLPHGADLIFCDLIANHVVFPRRETATVIAHRMISPPCLDSIAAQLSSSCSNA